MTEFPNHQPQPRPRKTRSIAIVAIALILLICALAFWLSRSTQPARTAISPITTPATRPALKPIRVGVYLSHYCATGANGTQWVYGHSCQMVADLRDPSLEVIPLLEPDSEKEPPIPKLITTYFQGHKPANITDPSVLKSLDVIVLPRINYVREDVLPLIDSAVKGGVGLLIRNTFGNGIPGYTPEVNRLSGFDDADFNYAPKPAECRIIADHPILGKLKKGDIIKITPNGGYGVLANGSTPLIQLQDTTGLMGNVPSDWIFYPLFISQLEKGRIVECVFPAWEKTPDDLQKATGYKFNVRVVKWLANRPLD